MNRRLSLVVLACLFLRLVDSRSADSPPLVTFAPLGAWPGYRAAPVNGVAIKDNFAFLASGEGGLVILDVSTPSSPTLVTSYAPGGIVSDMAINGNTAILANIETGGQSVRLVDISNPRSPQPLSTISAPAAASYVLSFGSRLFVTHRDSIVRSYEISDLRAPRAEFSWGPSVAGPPLRVDNLVFFDRIFQGDTYITVADPITGAETLTHWGLLGAFASVQLNRTVYVAFGSGGIGVLDVSNPRAPRLVRNLPGSRYNQLALAGSHLIAANPNSGLDIFSLADPSQPAFVRSFPIPGGASDVAISGSLAFVAASASGLRVLNIADPTNPQFVGAYSPVSGIAADIKVRGNDLFAAFKSAGLRVLDISNPSALAEAAHIGIYAEKLALDENRLYLAPAPGDPIVHGFDVTTSASPVYLGSFPAHGYSGIEARNGILFAATSSALDAIAIPSLSGGRHVPASLINSVQLASGQDTTLWNGLILAADGPGFLALPANPPQGSTWVATRCAYQFSSLTIAAVDRYAVVGGYSRVAVVDLIISPPPILGEAPSSGNVHAIEAIHNFVFFLDDQGLKVLDISDPTHPASAGFFPITLPSRIGSAIAVQNDLVFFTDPNVGVRVARFAINPRLRALSPQASASFNQLYPIFAEWASAGIFNPNWSLTLESGAGPTRQLSATIAPAGPGRWTAQWTATIDLPNACDFRLRLRDQNSGAETVSEPFCIEIVAGLEIFRSRVAGEISIRWPARFDSLRLHSSARPEGGWEPVPNSPTLFEDYKILSLPIGPNTRLFQLR